MQGFTDQEYNKQQLARFSVEGPRPLINGRLYLADFFGDESGRLRFGRDVIINSGFEANPVGGVRTTLLFKGPNALIEIGDRSGLSNVMIAAYERVSIGKDVNLGADCQIMDTDFHSLELQQRIANTHIPHRPVIIEDGAFIGTRAIILKGVTIGRQAVVAAGAVVARSIPPGEIWGGNPAKFLKKL